MSLLAISFTYQTMADQLRDRIAFTAEQKLDYEKMIIAAGLAQECVILSTCNRTEIYLEACQSVDRLLILQVQQFLAAHTDIDLPEIIQKSHLYTDDLATRHLMRVTCGLDSMLLGEDQIMGQVREACRQSTRVGHAGKQLVNLFQAAQQCARIVRKQTALARTPWSIPTLALQAALQHFEKTPAGQDSAETDAVRENPAEDASLRVLVLGGSGLTGQIIIRDLLTRYPEKVRVLAACRSHCTKLSALSHNHQQLELVHYSERYQLADTADLIISATRSPHLTLSAARCLAAFTQTRKRVFVDLAMPMDIDEGILQIEGSQLIRLDQIKDLAARNNVVRQAAAVEATDIVEQKADDFEKKRLMRASLPLVASIVEQTAWLGDYYTSDVLIRHVIHNVRDRVSQEELAIFFRCLEQGFGHKALAPRRIKQGKAKSRRELS